MKIRSEFNMCKIFIYGLMAVLFACSSAPKLKPVPVSEVKSAIAKAVSQKQQLLDTQVDLLANDDYKDGFDYLQDAQDGLSEGDDGREVIKDAKSATAYFQKAQKKAAQTGASDSEILKARMAALDAGLRNQSKLEEKLADIDDDLRDATSSFSKELKLKQFSKFQKLYLALEITAVQYRELMNARNRIKNADDKNAADLAPKTLKSAKIDTEVAENLIQQSPRSADVYKPSVEKANYSSILLADVMKVILATEGTPETVALKIVEQNRALAKLNSDVNQLKGNLSNTESDLQATRSNLQTTQTDLKTSQSNLQATQSDLQISQSTLLLTQTDLKSTKTTLDTQKQQLQLASTQVRFQKAMDESRKSFSNDEALVYQQGTKLVFRIKKMNFKSGHSTIPAASLKLLSKINDIVRKLNADNVIVEGHTDSVGPNDLNETLSTKRAIAVGRYLISLSKNEYKVQYKGYGETRPIASNDSYEGRAQNRRVDLIVTAR